jgi:hypothetical protein
MFFPGTGFSSGAFAFITFLTTAVAAFFCLPGVDVETTTLAYPRLSKSFLTKRLIRSSDSLQCLQTFRYLL